MAHGSSRTIASGRRRGRIAAPPERALDVPRALRVPRVARHQGQVRADRARRGLDGLPADGADARLHVRLRRTSRRSRSPACPYPVFALAGPHALDLRLPRRPDRGREPAGEHPDRDEDVVPADPDPARSRRVLCRRLHRRARPLLRLRGRSTAAIPTWRDRVRSRRSCSWRSSLTLGLSLFLSATNVRYRDVEQALPFIVQLWFFLSPVAYLLQTPGHSWETIVQALNPLVGLIARVPLGAARDPAAARPPRGLDRDLVRHLRASACAASHSAERTLADDALSDRVVSATGASASASSIWTHSQADEPERPGRGVLTVRHRGAQRAEEPRGDLGAPRRLLRRRSAARCSASSDRTAPASRRCSRSSRGSPSRPTGRAEIEGRVSSLLEVGTGFHPELTGRDNVFLNGAILGMTPAEIDAQVRRDRRVLRRRATSSTCRSSGTRSGMYVRLAFAVAAHLDPEVLLLDEVLAVGDRAFQEKCLERDAAR